MIAIRPAPSVNRRRRRGRSRFRFPFPCSFAYDALGRPLSTTTVIGGVSYASWAAQYDVWGRIRKTLDASGR